MRTDRSGRPGLRPLAGLFGALTLILAACSGTASSPAASSAPTAAAPTATAAPATAAASQAAASPSAAAKPLEIAYISFAVENSYDKPMLDAAKAAAAANNANLTVFDGNLKPPLQVKAIQDAIASGKFDAIVTQPVYGPALLTDVQNAIKAGIKVGNIDQILGTDNTTSKSQVDGLSANVAFVPSTLGKKIGDLVVTACADKKTNPCKVGYIWSVKAAALDTTLRKAFDEAVAAHPEIKVVAEGESFYTVPGGLKAAQDMLQKDPSLSVIVGADQAITGALTAVKAANLQDKINLVGYGGGALALKDIAAGQRFGTVMQMPATEGKLGIEQLIQAIRSGTPAPGVDPLDAQPQGGVVTKDNVQTFLPLAEWPG